MLFGEVLQASQVQGLEMGELSPTEQKLTRAGTASARLPSEAASRLQVVHGYVVAPGLVKPAGQWTLAAVAAVLAASVAFLVPAFLNGFPFLYPDSGDYLVLTPQIYRSPFYSFFLLLAHMDRFIWNAVLVQALMLSWLLFVLCKLHSSKPITTFLVLVAVLVPFSSAAYFASFIMADIMTPLMFLAMYIVAFRWSELSRFDRVCVFLFTCLATCSHIAHISMGIGIAALSGVLLVLIGKTWREVRRRLGLLLVPIVLSATALLLNNAIIHKSFSLYPAGNSLLMANLIEAGPGRHYIQSVCPDAGYKICQIADRLPRTANQLLWGGSYSELGGFRRMEKEAGEIVWGTIRAAPQDVLAMVARDFVAALQTHRPAQEFIPWTAEVPSMTALIEKRFGREARDAYLASAQSRGRVPRQLIGAVDEVAFPLSLLFFFAVSLLALGRQMVGAACLSIVVASGYVGNALLTSAASGVFDRYQARVSWLFLAVAVLLCARLSESVTRDQPLFQWAFAGMRPRARLQEARATFRTRSEKQGNFPPPDRTL